MPPSKSPRRNCDQTQSDHDKTTIVAPATGVIVQEMVQEGDYVRTGDQLVTFEATDNVEVLCTLTSKDLAWIRENKPVDTTGMSSEEVISSVYRIPKTDVVVYESDRPDVIWKGVLDRVDGIGRDNRTKTIPVRIVIDEPIIETDRGPRALVRNMYVKCRIEVPIEETDDAKKPLVFPAVALRPGNYVWISNNRQLERKKVFVLDQVRDPETDELMAVIRGEKDSVTTGDQIIISPLGQPTVGAEVRLDSDPVEIAEPEKDPAE